MVPLLLGGKKVIPLRKRNKEGNNEFLGDCSKTLEPL
jgi:hypothetical protein